MPDFEIRHVPIQEVAIAKVSCPTSGIGSIMGPTFGRVAEAITRAGGMATPPAFARYHSVTPERVDFDCGLGVAAPFSGDGEVISSRLGGCEAGVATHVGPYETIGDTWKALTVWLREQGRELHGPGWESYLTGPDVEPDPARWRTEIFLPLR